MPIPAYLDGLGGRGGLGGMDGPGFLGGVGGLEHADGLGDMGGLGQTGAWLAVVVSFSHFRRYSVMSPPICRISNTILLRNIQCKAIRSIYCKYHSPQTTHCPVLGSIYCKSTFPKTIHFPVLDYTYFKYPPHRKSDVRYWVPSIANTIPHRQPDVRYHLTNDPFREIHFQAMGSA